MVIFGCDKCQISCEGKSKLYRHCESNKHKKLNTDSPTLYIFYHDFNPKVFEFLKQLKNVGFIIKGCGLPRDIRTY